MMETKERRFCSDLWCSQIKNRTAFDVKGIFNFKPEGKDQIQQKTTDNRSETRINKKQAYAFDIHPQTIRQALAYSKSMAFKENACLGNFSHAIKLLRLFQDVKSQRTFQALLFFAIIGL